MSNNVMIIFLCAIYMARPQEREKPLKNIYMNIYHVYALYTFFIYIMKLLILLSMDC